MVSSKTELKDRDAHLMAAAFQSVKDPNGLQIDFEKLASIAGYTNIGSARNAYAVLKKKLVAGSQAQSDTKDAPATPKGKKKSVEDDGSNTAINTPTDDMADDEGTPDPVAAKAVSKKRAAPKKKPVIPKATALPTTSFTAINHKDNNINDATPAAADEANDSAVEEPTPAKKRRTYTRKPKDTTDTPPAKRARKATIAAVTKKQSDAAAAAASKLAEDAANAAADATIEAHKKKLAKQQVAVVAIKKEQPQDGSGLVFDHESGEFVTPEQMAAEGQLTAL